MFIVEKKVNTFNEVGDGAFFYLPNHTRCIRIAPVMVKLRDDFYEKVNYYNFFSGKFGYLSGLEPVTICTDKNLSLHVNCCGIEH